MAKMYYLLTLGGDMFFFFVVYFHVETHRKQLKSDRRRTHLTGHHGNCFNCTCTAKSPPNVHIEFFNN
jgi:hypothetical protein